MNLTAVEQAIAECKEEITRLEARKIEAEQRDRAIAGVKPLLTNYAEQHDLSKDEVFRALEKDIEQWIKSLRGESEGIHQHLKSYFARVISEGDAEPAKTQPAEPKLPAGLYTNPYNQEQVLKKTRAPKALREWVQIYGLGTVETWRR